MPLRPASPPLLTPQIRSGAYHLAGSAFGTTPTLLANGVLRVGPWYVPNACTITRIGTEVTAVGTAGSVYRLAIYGDDGTGYPGALILDAGTIDGTSASVQEKTVSLALTPGLYWVGGVAQGAPTTQATIRCANSPAPVQLSLFSASIPGVNAQLLGYADTNASSSLPATFSTTITGTASVPRVFVKA